jgi:hypothetical protein
MSAWFEVDKEGLAAILERRGKAFALAELVSNAWDSGTNRVEVRLKPLANRPAVRVEVEDFGEGFDDLAHSYTMFGRSRRAGDAEKRGRFCLGEKLVLACCTEAEIVSTSGGIAFTGGQRRRLKEKRDAGTQFTGIVKMTRVEHEDAVAFMRRMIPPVSTTIDGVEIERPDSLCRFTTRLPTEIADADGNLRRTMRQCEVEVYEGDESGEILEMGVPVVECDMPYRVNVLQKIPLNMDRDNVTPAFLKALQADVLNHMHDQLDAEEACESWVVEAAADARASTQAVDAVVRQRFGERAVIAVPGDPIANAQAEANGYTVVHGGSMSSGMWANVKKAGALLPASQVFPTMSAEQRAQAAAARGGACPMCGR